MIIYALVLMFSLISSVSGSIYVQAPNHVPKIYLETLLRKFVKPLQDIQELTGEGVQLEFSIRSPDETPTDIDESGKKSPEHEIRRSLRGKMLKKRGPSRIRSIPRLPPVRILSQQPSHQQTIKPRGRPPIKQSNKPQKRPPFRLNKMPNKPSLLTKPVNKLRSRQHLLVIPQSQHGQILPETHESQQRAHQERIAVTSHTVPQPSNQPPSSPPLPNLSASSTSHPAIPPDKKAIDLEDINKAFIDMEQRLRSGIVNETNTDGKNVLSNDALNKTLQIFEKRILDSIGGLRHEELKEQHLKKKQREKLICAEAKILREALTPVSFEELWKYLGNHKCEEDTGTTNAVTREKNIAPPSVRTGHGTKTERSTGCLSLFTRNNDHEDYTNDNIFIHTGDHSPPLKIPLANVYSRLIY